MQELKNSKTHRLSIKFKSLRQARQAKEERPPDLVEREHAYQAAFSEGQMLLSRIKELEANIERMEIEHGDLTQLATRHAELSGQLRVLYDNLFAGPTPDYPEEDEAETALTAVQHTVQQVRSTLPAQSLNLTDVQLKSDMAHERQVTDIYNRLVPNSELAEQHYRKALEASCFPNNTGKHKQTHHERLARQAYHEARHLERSLNILSPTIPVFTENVPLPLFNDGVAYREYADHCQRMTRHFQDYRHAAKSRLREMQQALPQREAELAQCTEHLRETRCRILLSHSTVPAPPYLSQLEVDVKRRFAGPAETAPLGYNM